MTTTNLRDFATKLAVYVRHQLSAVARGAMLIRCTSDDTVIGAVFGNDNFAWDVATRREVDLVRQSLKDGGLEEIGFGLSPEGSSWTLLVRPDYQLYQTDLGKAFQLEMAKIFLDEAVEGARRHAIGVEPDYSRDLAKERHEIG